MKLIIGCHVSFNNETELLGSVKEAIEYGANTFMIYTGNHSNTFRFPINENLVKEAHKLMKENDIDKNDIIIHAPFILNLANNTDIRKYNFYIHFLKQELKRLEQLDLDYLVLHPGSKVSLTIEEAIQNIAFGINQALKETNKNILLEFMSGKGSEVGSTIDELSKIYELIEKKEQVFICLDTCHMNDSGIDLNNFDSFLDEFDKKIGIYKIKCIHINDSYNNIGTKKDRHANIGYGQIGFNTLLNVIYNKRLEDIPKILETPFIKNETSRFAPFKYEIEAIKSKEFKDFIK